MASRSERIILASASTARAALLRHAGLAFDVDPADIDESSLKQAYRANGDSALACASALAVQKACRVSRRHPDALVIGADQLLVAGDEWFDKPETVLDAEAQLRSLRGRPHVLETAACVVFAGSVQWIAVSEPELTMYEFGDGFLAAYIAAEGEALLSSVGAYRLEGRGVQLFSRIAGDHFAILGLPLIELLGYLRERGAIAT